MVLHVSFNPGWSKEFLASFHPRVKIYLKRFAVYLTKMFDGKSMVNMQLQVYTKTMMLEFIQKRSKMFNFKTFKIVWLATINSVIVTVSLLINMYTALLLKIYDQRRQLDFHIIFHDFEKYCLWKVHTGKEEVCKSNSTFFGPKTVHIRDVKPWLSQFNSVSLFHRKSMFFQFLLVLKKRFLKKVSKDAISTLYQLFKQRNKDRNTKWDQVEN